MLDSNTVTLMDSLVGPILDAESRELNRKLTRAAEQTAQAGLAGSGLAQTRQIIVHHDHHKELAAAVWSAMLRVLNEAHVTPYPELAGDLKRKFEAYLAASANRIRSSMVAFSLGLGQPGPKETFDGICEEIRAKYSAEIQLHCHRAAAELKKQQETHVAMNITYNLTGENPRVNINSTDYSINSTNAGPIFGHLVEAIRTGVPDQGLRDQLIGKTRDLESAVADKHRYLRLYKEFMAVVADHVTVIGPFIPALAQYLTL
jgi:hypothetical protein